MGRKGKRRAKRGSVNKWEDLPVLGTGDGERGLDDDDEPPSSFCSKFSHSHFRASEISYHLRLAPPRPPPPPPPTPPGMIFRSDMMGLIVQKIHRILRISKNYFFPGFCHFGGNLDKKNDFRQKGVFIGKWSCMGSIV